MDQVASEKGIILSNEHFLQELPFPLLLQPFNENDNLFYSGNDVR